MTWNQAKKEKIEWIPEESSKMGWGSGCGGGESASYTHEGGGRRYYKKQVCCY